VEYNETNGIIPIAKTKFYNYDNNLDTAIQIIPTIFIKNEVFIKATTQEIDSLVNNVYFLINKYYYEDFHAKLPLSEIQLDCDWTIKSKENYFYFLKKFKKHSKKLVSCTLRLYPYKYTNTMGVPPVDKVSLMCYNLLNPLVDASKNSILDTDELKLYLNTKKKYPLHVDISLPIFSWLQVYQYDQFKDLIYTDTKTIKNILKPIRPLWYEVTQDTLLENCYLRIGDKIKMEEISKEKISTAIEIIKKNVFLESTTTVTLFHLDDSQLNNYTHEEISSFFSDFSK
jgi:hypothetical protein